MVPEVVYEDQFALEDVADLEHWVIEVACDQGLVTLANLRNGFLDEKSIRVRYHVIKKAPMRLGYRWDSSKDACEVHKDHNKLNGNTECNLVHDRREFS